jgi:hypothetical protein
LLLAVLAAAVVVVAAVLVGAHVTSQPATSPSPSGTLPPGTLKPVLSGLVDFNGEPSSQYAGVFDGWVVNVPWSRLEPSGPGLVGGNPVDQAISQADALDRQHPGHAFRIKVRVLAGIDSPGWVKTLGGSPVLVTEPGGGHVVSGTTPRFWTAPVGDAYNRLMQELATRYDSAPEVGDVVISRCMTVYAEPMVRQYNNRQSVADMLAAGYTSALDDICQHQEIDAAKVFRHTHVSISISPYERIDAPGGPVLDDSYAISIAEYCRSTLGQQCVLGNNELGRPVFDNGPEQDSPIYQAIGRLGPPTYFQVEANTNRIGSGSEMQAAIAQGISDKAAYLEVDKVVEQLGLSQIQSDNGQLVAQAGA